jgi:hypothetical protein
MEIEMKITMALGKSMDELIRTTTKLTKLNVPAFTGNEKGEIST